jgi:hypothetical protein
VCAPVEILSLIYFNGDSYQWCIVLAHLLKFSGSKYGRENKKTINFSILFGTSLKIYGLSALTTGSISAVVAMIVCDTERSILIFVARSRSNSLKRQILYLTSGNRSAVLSKL